MPTKYTPATFQPTVRPSWGGILSYIGEKEKAEILEAIIKFPMVEPINSKFWEETIKPDLEQQYEKFKTTCIARGRGAQTYWGEHKLSLSITQGKDKDNSLKDKDKDKDKGKSKEQDKSITPKLEQKEIYKESFDLFWEEYPKQRAGSKLKAYQAYCKAIKEKRATEEQILESVQNYKTCDEVKRGYAKGCAAWLNDDRFNNEYVPKKEQSEMTEEELLAWGRG